MKKRTYRSTDVKHVNAVTLSEQIEGQRVAVGVDVAKEDFKAAVMEENRQVLKIIKWKHPYETRLFVEFLLELEAQVEIAMESSGTYGAALQEMLHDAGLPVFQVSAKRVHDAAEVYDGVPSHHDAKCAAIIAKLQLDEASRRWEPSSEEERGVAAAIKTMDLYHDQFYSNCNRLEALLAVYWPEVTQYLELGSATLRALLIEFGSPGKVAERPEEARALMVRVGRSLKPEKIEKVLESAGGSVGVEPIDEEVKALQDLVADTQRAHQALRRAKAKVERLGQKQEPTRNISRTIGQVTAAVIVSEVGDPLDFYAAAAYEKAMGLNLKERSSGKHQGKLRITKRGSGMARKYLYLATLRLLQEDVIVKAWYARKVARDGGVKMKAIVALMRKLARALWYVARGEAFDSRKLFNVRRLKLAA